MSDEARQVSGIDSARLQLHLTLPVFLLGLVTPNRFFVRLFVKLGTGERTARFLRQLREKYGSDHLWVWFPVRRTLIVMAPAGIDAVLAAKESSPDPCLKKRALSRFVPDGLIVSPNPEAPARRRFNTHVLDLGHLHRHSEAFVTIAANEAARLTAEPAKALRWPDFQSLGQRISHQVILGMAQGEPELAEHLARMLPFSNCFLRNGTAFRAFYERIDRLLARNDAASPAPCLMHDALADNDLTPSTSVPSQIGFWFFVLKDAVELHVARTLALIAGHPEVQDKVRHEIQAAAPLTATAIDGLRYLEACITEALRLWTPVPLLFRRAEKGFELGGTTHVDAEDQMLVHAGVYHRDPRVFGEFADKFAPDAAMDPAFPKRYVFSDQGRSCAGRTLAMFVVKATLAPLLAGSSFDLRGPSIQAGRIAYAYDHFAIDLRHQPGA
jgi:cytochrome P450